MNKYIVIIIIVIIGLFAWQKSRNNNPVESDRTLITSAKYFCDNNKNISATYYSGPDIIEPTEQPPTVTDSVDISLDGGEMVTLMQVISASGARYANNDESLVFWNKGKEAIIMRGNAMDLDYKNCISKE